MYYCKALATLWICQNLYVMETYTMALLYKFQLIRALIASFYAFWVPNVFSLHGQLNIEVTQSAVLNTEHVIT